MLRTPVKHIKLNLLPKKMIKSAFRLILGQFMAILLFSAFSQVSSVGACRTRFAHPEVFRSRLGQLASLTLRFKLPQRFAAAWKVSGRF